MTDPDYSQNLMGSKLDQDPSDFFHDVQTNSICIIHLTNKQKKKSHENNASLAEVIKITYCTLQPLNINI